MAKINSPFGGSGVKGTANGLTFSIWKGLQIMRRKSNPVRRMRRVQTDSRSRLGWLSRLYGTLTQAQRDLWDQWATEHPVTGAFGEPLILSGHQMYIKLNFIVGKLFGDDAINAVPPVAILESTVNNLVAATGTVVAGDVILTWEVDGGGDAGDLIEVGIAGPYLSPARREVFEARVYNSAVVGTAVTTTIQSLLVGFWYWFFVRYVGADGQTTAYQVDQATPFVGI